MPTNSVKVKSVNILYRDGMELKEDVVLAPPAPSIEPTLTLEQGMEVRHIANGNLVTVSHGVTPEGQKLTGNFQIVQMTGVDDFCNQLFRIAPPGTLIFDRILTMQVHFRRGDHPQLLQSIIFQTKSPVYVIPKESEMKVPPAVVKTCPIQAWDQMDKEIKYDILYRYIRAYGAENVPQAVRVVTIGVLTAISALIKAGPISSVEVSAIAVNQHGYGSTTGKNNVGDKVNPRPAYSPVERAASKLALN